MKLNLKCSGAKEIKNENEEKKRKAVIATMVDCRCPDGCWVILITLYSFSSMCVYFFFSFLFLNSRVLFAHETGIDRFAQKRRHKFAKNERNLNAQMSYKTNVKCQSMRFESLTNFIHASENLIIFLYFCILEQIALYKTRRVYV